MRLKIVLSKPLSKKLTNAPTKLLINKPTITLKALSKIEEPWSSKLFNNISLKTGFAVYHLSDPNVNDLPLTSDFFESNEPSASSGSFINTRQVSARLKLRPGTYLIVPSTYEPNEEGEFLIRVYSEQPANIECVKE